MAPAALAPHMSCVGLKLAQNAGRPGCPKIAQRMSGNNCTQRSPAFFPCGIPGIGEVIEGAMQHAPHSGRHSIGSAELQEHFRPFAFGCGRIDEEAGLVNFTAGQQGVAHMLRALGRQVPHHIVGDRYAGRERKLRLRKAERRGCAFGICEGRLGCNGNGDGDGLNRRLGRLRYP